MARSVDAVVGMRVVEGPGCPPPSATSPGYRFVHEGPNDFLLVSPAIMRTLEQAAEEAL